MRLAGRLSFIFTLTAFHASLRAADELDIKARLDLSSNRLTVVIKNNPYSETRVGIPIVEWVPGIDGIEFRIWTIEGDPVPSCVMRDYSSRSFQKEHYLRKAEIIKKEFLLSDIKKDFCLISGKYYIQYILHNDFSGGGETRPMYSNPVVVVVN